MEVTLVSTAPAPRVIYKAGTDRVKLLSSIDLITPDSAAPKFIDALAEAADRAAKEKADKEEKGNYFPVIFIVGNNGLEGSNPRDYQVNKLFKRRSRELATVHVVMLSSSSRSARHRRRHEPDRGRHQADAADRRALRGDRRADEAHELLPEFADADRAEPGAAVEPVPNHLPAAGRLQAAADHRRDAARRHLRGAHLRRARSVTICMKPC